MINIREVTEQEFEEFESWYVEQYNLSYNIRLDLINCRGMAGYLKTTVHNIFMVWRAFREEIQTLKEKVKKYEERLEIGHCWQSTANGPVMKIAIPENERENEIDGIEARDCTIKLLESEINRYVRQKIGLTDNLKNLLKEMCDGDYRTKAPKMIDQWILQLQLMERELRADA